MSLRQRSRVSSGLLAVLIVLALVLAAGPVGALADTYPIVYPSIPANLNTDNDAGPTVSENSSLVMTFANPVGSGPGYAVLGATVGVRARRNDTSFDNGRVMLAQPNGTDLWSGTMDWTWYGDSQSWNTRSRTADYENDGAVLAYLQSQVGVASLGLNLEVGGEDMRFDRVSLQVQAEPITGGPAIQGICTAADIHLVVDNSLSIGDTNMTAYIQNIKSFMATVEAGMPGTNWRVTSFNTTSGSRNVHSTAWAADPASLTAFIDGMESDGYTTTPSGINAAVAGGATPDAPMVNNANNVMIVLTDGAPNVRLSGDIGFHYMEAAAEAIEQAEAARLAGWSTIVVAIGSGDDNVEDAWAANVNRGIAGVDVAGPSGNVLSVASFASLGTDLINLLAPGCQRNIVVGKVWDSTGAPADATTFSGKVDAGGAGLTWSNLGFGQFSAAIPVSIGSSHVVTENAPANGWTTTGYALGSSDTNGLPVCPTTMASYTGTSITVPAGSGQAVVCVANRKAPTPALTLDKTTTATGYAAVGDSISYSYLLTNSGNVALSGPFTVADDKATVTCPDTASLAPSGTITCSASYTITQADLNVGSVTNKATATGSFGSTPVTSNEATQTVTAEVSALLSIVKTATNPIVNSGGTVTFSITVTNDGNVDLTDVTVDDPLASDCDETIGALAATDAAYSYTCTLTNVTADFTNTATVIGTTPLGGTVTDSDTAAVDVRPTISVAKTASASSVPEPGADVTYTVTVTNDSNEPVTITSLQDAVGSAAAVDLVGDDDCKVGTELAATGSTTGLDSCTFQFTDTVSGSPTPAAGASVTDTVTAKAEDNEDNEATATGSATVGISDVPSSIEVTKTASTATVVYPGGDVTFTVTVTNTSLVDAVTITSLTDNLHGDAANGDSLDGVGDCALPGAGLVLAAANDGDTDTYTCSYAVAITGDPGETFTDTAATAGTDDDGNAVSASDSATVQVEAVGLTLTPEYALNYLDQDDACHVFTAQLLDADGNPLSVAGVEITFSLGDHDNDAAIQGADATGEYEATTNASGQATVTVCATEVGYVGIEGRLGFGATITTVTSEPDAVAFKQWIDSGLQVVKTADQTAIHSGDTVVYTYEISHGLIEGALYDVELWDDMGTPADTTDDVKIVLTGLTDEDGDSNLDDLAWNATATGSLSVSLSADTTNWAEVTAYDAPGCDRPTADECTRTLLSAEDDANVDVLNPAITLTKTASVVEFESEAGGPVTYTYTVANTGDVELGGVTVTDDKCGPGGANTPLVNPVESLNADGMLEVGETWTYQCSQDVTVTTTNVATVTAYDPLQAEVGASAEATVTVPEIATAVELKGWTALGGADAVTLGWTTLRENDVVEFRLYRSIGADLAGATLVARIPAQGSADGGYEKAYSYVDGGLSAGTYNYWLVEANDSDSEKVVAGPTAAVVGVDDQARTNLKVYVPLLMR
ncbi:MAG: DUF7507 domain-containing protein [Anaerolineae bacterium]